MNAYGRTVVRTVIFVLMAGGMCGLWAQPRAADHSVLHIQQSVTTSKTGFPQFLYMYKVLDGAKSPPEALALSGNISLANHTPNFSEVL